MNNLKSNIVLIGMPGCGKTTVGKVLSKKLKYKFCDMDSYIQQISKKTIKELFEQGEENFRDWETKACEELVKLNNIVINLKSLSASAYSFILSLTQSVESVNTTIYLLTFLVSDDCSCCIVL